MAAHINARKFVECFLNDLRSLSTEAKKRYNHVKEASESGIVKIKNITSSSQPEDLFQDLRASCTELLHPLLLACSTKNPRLVQISLQAIQHMLQFKLVDKNSSSALVNELWNLTEAECEELKVLQTVTPFVSTDILVTDWALARCIGLAVKLNFSKDSSVINAASAAVRQLFSAVFERVVQEDGMRANELTIIPQSVKNATTQQQNLAPPTLRPAAADGFLLLKDLNLLIRKEVPLWLPGVKRMTITLALELLETILRGFPSIFFNHIEYAELLKSLIFPQILKMFIGGEAIAVDSPENLKTLKPALNFPPFPIMVRSLRISLVLLTYYNQILESKVGVMITYLLEVFALPTQSWESAAVAEVIHKVVTQPDLLKWICENYDQNPTSSCLLNSIFASINSFLHRCLDDSLEDSENHDENELDEQQGFVYRNTFLPLHEISPRRSILLDWLEKHNAERIPEAYGLTIAYFIYVDATRSINNVMEDILDTANTDQNSPLHTTFFRSTYSHLLNGLALLLNCSIGEVTEPLVGCLYTAVCLSCKIGSTEEKLMAIRVICRAALMPGYFDKFIEKVKPTSIDYTDACNFGNLPADQKYGEIDIKHLIAVGTMCPMINQMSVQSSVVLTEKNLKIARLLLSCAQNCGQQLGICWDHVLATIQHLYWVLGVRQISSGTFRIGGDGNHQQLVDQILSTTQPSQNSTILTISASNDIPDLSKQLDGLFESTTGLDDVSLHHVIASLCKLSSDQMEIAQITSKETSYFGLAKLLHTALSNLDRIHVFWKPVASHLLDICAHSNAKMREWGSLSLIHLVRGAMAQHKSLRNIENGQTIASSDSIRIEQQIMQPISSLSDIDYADVRTRQLECLVNILHSDSPPVSSQLWPTVINIVISAMNIKDGDGTNLIDQGYKALSVIVKEFLNIIPFNCIHLLIDTDTKYAKQQTHLNVSLAAVVQLWDISDYMRCESSNHSTDETEQIWLSIYHSLGELCVDSRPPIRKSAGDSLLQTIAAHGHAMRPCTWGKMIEETLFPLLEQVQLMTQMASTQRITSTTSLGAPNIMIHHSRDTELKQWAETSAKSIGGIVRIFNAHRNTLIQLDEFSRYWTKLLEYIEHMANTDNSEISLAAIKNLRELLFGRQQLAEEKSLLRGRKSPSLQFESLTPLPEGLWIVSWDTWLKIANTIVLSNPNINDKMIPKHYIPGTFHLTTLLSFFSLLLTRVRHQISSQDQKLHLLFQILQEIPKIPVTSDQTPFSLSTRNAELNSTQEVLLECIQAIFQEQLDPSSNLRRHIPTLLRVLLEYFEYALHAPLSVSSVELPKHNLTAFAETSLQNFLDYYAKVASYDEVINERILIEAFKALKEPLILKYNCPAQSTWKLSATTFLKICKVGLPIARENCNHFKDVWGTVASILEGFLFSNSKPSVPLNSNERKQHEFLDCLMVEMIRSELLPFANNLPNDFMSHIIDILNRGSISTMDSTDVMDAYQQRIDLSRVCFEGLLSLGQMEGGRSQQNGKRSSLSSPTPNQTNNSASLGATAISSLLDRCKQVLNNYARDYQGSGHFRLPQERMFEVISVLRAVSTLIDGMAKGADGIPSYHSLYSLLVGLYPSLVQLIPSCREDQQIELSLMATLNSYQTVMLINLHKNS